MTSQSSDPEVGFSHDDLQAHASEARGNEPTTGTGNEPADQASSPRVPIAPVPSSESQSNERLGRLLGQRKGLDAVMIGVLSVALLLGLIGLVLHPLWIVAIIVMALGLGFAVANSRRDRIDVLNQRADQVP
jgi:hypothetical protein